MLSPDYAQFEIEKGQVVPGPRMKQKLEAIPLPDFNGKTVLDVGCDYGQFSFYAASKGAKVLGLDRNRNVRGKGYMNLISIGNANAKTHRLNCRFEHMDIGKQWREFGKFDHVLVMSVYHHLFNNCGDHKAVWFWLWRHCGESLIFEGPLDESDRVVQMNVDKGFKKSEILDAAGIYFDLEYIGPALHEPHRYVYRMTPKETQESYKITPQDGSGGATKAFLFENERRMNEIEQIVGYRPFPGSLNCVTDRPFHFNSHYYTGQLLDVKDRGLGLLQDWELKETRFYPVSVNGVQGHVLRMKSERYAPNFIEIISSVRLRDGETTECGF